MKCPDGLHWIPDREFCSKCPPGQVFNAQWGECQGMDRTVINPGQYHTATAALFGLDGLDGINPKVKKYIWLMLFGGCANAIGLLAAHHNHKKKSHERGTDAEGLAKADPVGLGIAGFIMGAAIYPPFLLAAS